MSTVNGRPDGGLLYPRVPVEETVTGVPNGGTTGQVLGKLSATDQDTGWIDQTGGSGGGGGGATPAWVTYHPDTPPASPTLFGGVNYNLEYTAGETALGTAIGSPTLAASIVDRSLRIAANLTAANAFVAQEFPCPVGTNFTMTVRFRRKFQLQAYSVAHIGLRANTSGAGQMTQLLQVHRNTGTWNETDGSVEHWTSESSGGTSINDNTPLPTLPWWYYRLKYTVGVGVEYSWSTNGFEDDYQLFVSQTTTQAFGAGNTPGRCFFGARGLNASFRPYVYIDWVRFT